MQIYFLRHANAGEPKLNPARDEKRPLDKLGIEQCHDVGRALDAMEVKLGAVISSPLRRAVETAKIVAKEIGHKNDPIIDDALRPGASYTQFQELLQRQNGHEAIMVVGHNPNQTDFLNRLLAGGGTLNAVELKKGSIARVDKDGRKAGILKWCMTPKVVRSIQRASASSSRPKAVSK